MRLMLLGSEQTGKTSLLQAFKRESSNLNNPQQPQRRVIKKNFYYIRDFFLIF
jgi:GTPase SAR1 family protein